MDRPLLFALGALAGSLYAYVVMTSPMTGWVNVLTILLAIAGGYALGRLLA